MAGPQKRESPPAQRFSTHDLTTPALLISLAQVLTVWELAALPQTQGGKGAEAGGSLCDKRCRMQCSKPKLVDTRGFRSVSLLGRGLAQACKDASMVMQGLPAVVVNMCLLLGRASVPVYSKVRCFALKHSKLPLASSFLRAKRSQNGRAFLLLPRSGRSSCRLVSEI